MAYKKREKKVEKSEDDALLETARELFQVVVSAEADSRRNMVDDQRFFAGSPDNFWQWPEKIRSVRENDANGNRPCLTINKLPHHVRQITNDQRQNKIGIHVIAVDDKGDPEVAEMLEGLIRHIEYRSDADVAYTTANETQVVCGIGFIRVRTEYVSPDSFDQELRIERVRNPMSIYLDPSCQQPDGSDAKYAFVTEMMSKDEFEQEYPNASTTDWSFVGPGDRSMWYERDMIRVAEFYRIEGEYTTLNLWADGRTTYGQERPNGVSPDAKPIKSRDVCRDKVCWYKITGSQILDQRELPGRFIPIARVVGNEFDVEGRVFYSGVVRTAKDAQRIYNYWVSQEAEMLALAPKAPFVGAAGQFEGWEEDWKQANVKNHAYLQYNPVSEGGALVPPPQRQPPVMPQAGIIAAKQGADEDLKSTTGQWNPSLGAPSNETSGTAIGLRQRESDSGSYHYLDNLSRGVRHVGRICLDLIPYIYDTRRTVRTLDEAGEEDYALIDPHAQHSVQPLIHPVSGKAVGNVYNPKLGQYDVAIVTGPSFTTQRQEARQAMSEMVQASPQLWGVIGDLLVKNMDWPGSQSMAERLKATLMPAVQKVVQQQELPPGSPPPPEPPPPPQVQLELDEKAAKVHSLQLDNMERMRSYERDVPTDNTAGAVIQARTQAQIAQMDAATKAQIAKEDRDSRERIEMAKIDQKHTEALSKAVHQANEVLMQHKQMQQSEQNTHQRELVATLAKVLEAQQKPKVLKVQRNPDGSLAGATSETVQ